MSEWQPIETAPKDARILLYRPTTPYEWARVVVGKFDPEEYASKPRGFWSHDAERLAGVADARKNPPSHWMPLPPPPSSPKGAIMADIELPELPWPTYDNDTISGLAWDDAAMTAYGLACYRVALEKAAERCEAQLQENGEHPEWAFTAVAAIRSLMKEPS